MDLVELSEHVALVALLQNRPEGHTWAELTAEVLSSGSAVKTWETLVPAGLFEQPGEESPLEAAARDVEAWSKAGLSLLSILDDLYPTRLRGIHQAPPVLFSRGKLLPEDPAVSIVGSRNASDRGLTVAREITRALITEGFAAVSGLAAGIDATVHQAALDAQGRTVAVIGTGINKVYPASNRALQRQISEKGLVLSQFWPDAPPQKSNFLMRNATMSGYGIATIVVEAGEHSGTRYQARMAVEHGRPVILTDIVVERNEWAQKLCGRPGVYRADGLRDVIAVVRKVATERVDTVNELLDLLPVTP
ncbi:DNA-processing protein DprA [Amycolatopsis sp. cg5]|uniref:DNA-processing protein DprA n=1 Tax=Amycolatopsis sp. cg5 TaxID=3238802 RepID=UPI0035246DD2